MGDGDHDQVAFVHRINHAVGKKINFAFSGIAAQRKPGQGKLRNQLESPDYLSQQRVT